MGDYLIVTILQCLTALSKTRAQARVRRHRMRYQRKLAAFCLALLTAQTAGFTQPCYAETTTTPDAKSTPIVASLTKPDAKRPRIGLALGGGGTRGAAHIGVLRVLEKEGIKVDCIAGTSIGAIVGGLYCAGVPLDDIEKMVAKKSLKKAYFTVPLWFRVALVPVFILPHAFGHPHYDGLYRGNKFANFLNKAAGPKEQKIEDFKIQFRAVAASLLDREPHAIKSGNLGRALQASSAIPVLRRPVEIDNNLYLDGGILNNLPIDEVRDMGADVVIAVSLNTDDDGCDERDFKQFKRIGSVGNRVINMVLSHVDKSQLKDADIFIQPRVNEIKFLSLKESDAYVAIDAGEDAAEAAMADIKKKIAEKTSAIEAGIDNTSSKETQNPL